MEEKDNKQNVNKQLGTFRFYQCYGGDIQVALKMFGGCTLPMKSDKASLSLSWLCHCHMYDSSTGQVPSDLLGLSLPICKMARLYYDSCIGESI